ncbi:GNAT family N-acetyltransferase [Paenibacillus sp. GCM10012303]|uniref:GNAT family N-acetyltransferase n=1 Tax=Paenibacillus sp. GCM10012303 TaxID=3317340 RepID=UPI00361BB3F6
MMIRNVVIQEIDHVLKILNETTVHLISKGISQWSFPWEPEMIINEISSNHCFIVKVGEVICGVFFIRDIDCLNGVSIDPCSKYLSKIAISPEFQGMGYGSKILAFACTFAQDQNSTLYLDCWAGNDKLKAFYVNNGMEYLGDYPEESYFISVFRKR